MLIQRANVYRLEPTTEQADAFNQWVGACRFVYNIALEQRRTWGKSHRLSYNQQQAEITPLRVEADVDPENAEMVAGGAILALKSVSIRVQSIALSRVRS